LPSSSQGNPTINTIIDIYHGNGIDLEETLEGGIVAIIHKATQGASFLDSKYHERREAAKDLRCLLEGVSFLDRAAR
jgi:lysozyme